MSFSREFLELMNMEASFFVVDVIKSIMTNSVNALFSQYNQQLAKLFGE